MQRMTGLSAARFDHIAIGAVMIATIGVACLGVKRASAQAGASDYAAFMAAPDRSDGDRQADKRRDPIPFVAFAGLRPAMKVLDMGPGVGYSTELDAPRCRADRHGLRSESPRSQ
jgi:predicted methyltransferase